MGLLDDLTQGGGGGLGDLASLAAKHPQAVAAILALLSRRDSTVGGSGGLGGVIDAFQRNGLGGVISSWISTGPNPPVTAAQVTDIFGSDVLSEFAAKAGVPQHEAGGLLASLLPAVIDQLTPRGEEPPPDEMESSLGGFLSSLLK